MNLLVTGAWQGYADNAQLLQEMGHEVVFMQQEADALPCAPEWVEGVIGNGIFLHHSIEQFPHLRYIQLTSAGADRVDMDYVRAHGITLHTAGATYAIPMAEFTLCGVLELYKDMRGFAEKQMLRRWEKNCHLLELHGKHVLIIGCGNYGRACAERFRAFGCHITGLDVRTDIHCPAFHTIAHVRELDARLPQADIIVLAAPGTEENRHLFDHKRMELVKQGAVLTNLCRGNLVAEYALALAIQHGKLLGAVADVFEREPLHERSLLWNYRNVIVTPHNSFVGEGNAARLNEVIIENLRAE